ncbi:histidine kinase dimerization/phosphoacceptor domain -containing protein [Brevundimonas sp. DC300-4]|uniref:histidine kinase dimerization/phosphoacceptor domain -containing protein n=1 Tax=Brevundimonas sp. DC300-4 TaxID=2804594 RepID=UPI003CFBBD55
MTYIKNDNSIARDQSGSRVLTDINASDAETNAVVEDTQFRMLAENIPTLCWMANADGSIYWYNRRWHEYCGSTPQQMQGWGWQSAHDPAILPAVLARWTACIASGDPFEMTFPLRGADGTFRPFLTRVQPARDGEGNIVGWFGVNTDVSAQIEAEAELRTTNMQLQAIAAEREAILGQLGEGVIVTDPHGRITFVNEAATRLHGVTRIDVEPDDYTRAYSLSTEFGEPHPIETLPLTRAVRHAETVIDARWRIRRPDDTEVLAIGNARPVYAADASLIGAVLTIRDDTSRHAAEEALGEALRIKELLLQEVNHRVKNSLQLVVSLLTLQAGKTPANDVRQSLLDACSRIGVVAAMHENLYTTGSHDRVDLTAYLRELTTDLVAALDSEGIVRLQFADHGEVVVDLDDAVPIALVINELLTNSMKYAFKQARSGKIEIAVRTNAGEIQIAISDDGVGIPDDFDPNKSTGLGMRIVAALTKQVRGQIDRLPSAQGTSFVVTIPRPME